MRCIPSRDFNFYSDMTGKTFKRSLKRKVIKQGSWQFNETQGVLTASSSSSSSTATTETLEWCKATGERQKGRHIKTTYK